MMRAPRIAIVGGGAAALPRRWRWSGGVLVCEQSPALSDKGAGLHVSPNAVMALRATFPSLSQVSAVLY
jgi:2-polyprenyl-6-methoxyphenol hydroxylase-like FAD-dependent oxidoreductase